MASGCSGGPVKVAALHMSEPLSPLLNPGGLQGKALRGNGFAYSEKYMQAGHTLRHTLGNDGNSPVETAMRNN